MRVFARCYKLTIFTGLLFLSTQSFCSSLPTEIKLLTYNVLDNNELNKTRGKKTRGQAVLSVLANADADFLVLQEVNLAFFESLKSATRFTQYQVYGHQQFRSLSSGLVILAKSSHKTSYKITMRYESLPSTMGRGLLYLMLKKDDQFLCIANVHLDSMLDDTAIRIKQLNAVFHHLRYCDDIVLSGDFNFGNGEEEEGVFPEHYQDIWRQLKPDDKGLTYNRELNQLSDDKAFFFEKSRRLDRIYLSSDCLAAHSIELKGNKPVNQGLMPSDHFAVLAVFLRKQACK